MGKQQNSLDKLILNNPFMSKYNTFTIEEKNFIDEVILKYVKKNFTISVTKIVTKKIKPKTELKPKSAGQPIKPLPVPLPKIPPAGRKK